MKTKITLFLMIVLLSLPIPITRADDKDVERPIPLDLVYNDEFRNNRGFIPLPIECYYAVYLKSIQTTVYDNLGEITIEVLNTTTGEYIYDSFDSVVTQQHILNITGSSGFYTITYTTESGETYLGTLELF